MSCPKLFHARFISTMKTCTERVSSGTMTREALGYINAFVSFNPSNAASKEGQLSGLSIAVKDNICTSALPTTCASNMLKDYHPTYNATVVELLEQARALIIGKTNCDEFGMGSLNVHTAFGPVINPFNPGLDPASLEHLEQRSAGGSSGGSAAAVASKQCFAALSTDTGGSTRLPASYCGVVGLKPSYGLLSRWGIISFADSLDTVGVIASRTCDVRRVFDIVSKFDDKDPTSIPPDLRARAEALCYQQAEISIPRDTKSLQGLRVGIPQEYFPAELDPSILKPFRRILGHLRALGASLIPVSLPSTPYALSTYYVLASAEASSNMARYDGVRYGTYIPPPLGTDTARAANVYAYSRSHGFGREVRKRILLGTYALTADAFDNYFLQAQRLRRLVRADFDNVFRIPNVLSGDGAGLQFRTRAVQGGTDVPPARESTPQSRAQAQASTTRRAVHGGVDVLLHPSAIRTAPRLCEALAPQGLEAYVQDVLTVPASLAGVPAMSVPAGYGEDGWPVGVSVVSQWGCEEMVLRVGEAVEGAAATLRDSDY